MIPFSMSAQAGDPCLAFETPTAANTVITINSPVLRKPNAYLL